MKTLHWCPVFGTDKMQIFDNSNMDIACVTALNCRVRIWQLEDN